MSDEKRSILSDLGFTTLPPSGARSPLPEFKFRQADPNNADDRIAIAVSKIVDPITYCLPADTIVVRDDGSILVVPKGTLITVPVPVPQPS